MAVVRRAADALLQSTLVDLQLSRCARAEQGGRGETSSPFFLPFSANVRSFVFRPRGGVSLYSAAAAAVPFLLQNRTERTHIKRWPMRLIVNSAHFETMTCGTHICTSCSLPFWISLATFDPLLSHVHFAPFLFSFPSLPFLPDCFSVSSSSIRVFLFCQSNHQREWDGRERERTLLAHLSRLPSSISWWIFSDWWERERVK